jgi:hypothetical protein
MGCAGCEGWFWYVAAIVGDVSLSGGRGDAGEVWVLGVKV